MTSTLSGLTGPRSRRAGIAVLAAATLALAVPATAHAATTTYPSDSTPPNLVKLLAGYNNYWISAGTNDLHGTVVNSKVLSRDDRLTVWINQNATKAQQFKALQDSEYQTTDNTAYDQSYTVSTGLGSELSALYVKGRNSGALPLTTALINSSNGTAGAYVGTSAAKTAFSHPRPYLPTDAAATAVTGDDAACDPAKVNASSQAAIRIGQSYADAKGNLKVTRVPVATDTTHQFSPNAVKLDPGYGTVGICTGGSFPSGHTTTAFQAGITLATLVPELAPEVLARASENGNDRIVLGVHYPLDIMGGRMNGEAAVAARWSDKKYRTEVLEPARKELLNYLTKTSGKSLAQVIKKQKAYSSNPYGGKKMPGGTAQIVTNRKSAVKVYTERLTYGFGQSGTKGLKASVPTGAENLLITTFPKLTSAQRKSVLAQTEIASGFPLDQTQAESGSWERLNLAAAMSATVQVSHGKAKVLSTGGTAKVIFKG